jgi:hypothetical protein
VVGSPRAALSEGAVAPSITIPALSSRRILKPRAGSRSLQETGTHENTATASFAAAQRRFLCAPRSAAPSHPATD